MKTSLILSAAMIFIAAFSGTSAALQAADAAGQPLVDMVIDLVKDKDKDMRAIGFQQVREEVKGTAATKRFAELLPTLPPDAQAGLIDALAARGDKAARSAIVETLQTPDEPVRAAGIRALGVLGEAGNVSLMAKWLTAGAESEKTAARQSLEQIRAEGVDEKIAQELKVATGDPRRQIALIEIAERRKDLAAVPVMIYLALSGKADIFAPAMQALGQLAAADDIPKLVEILLKSEPGGERDGAEKTILSVCQRIKAPDKRADPLLAVWDGLGDEQKTILLPGLGRMGGAKVLAVVDQAIAGGSAQRRDAGVRALCNWPDASVAPKLLALAQSADNAEYRSWALRALTRVAVLRDSRSDAERLELLKKAMTLAGGDDERNYALDRAKAIRTMDCVRFVLSHMDRPELAQHASATIVELAHYRELRDPNKDEFDKALDKVIAICTDPTLVDYARRYKRGETIDIRAKTSQ